MCADQDRAIDVSVDELLSAASPACALSALVSESSCDSIDGTEADADVVIAPTTSGVARTTDSTSSSRLRIRRVRLMWGGLSREGSGRGVQPTQVRYRFDTLARKLDARAALGRCRPRTATFEATLEAWPSSRPRAGRTGPLGRV